MSQQIGYAPLSIQDIRRRQSRLLQEINCSDGADHSGEAGGQRLSLLRKNEYNVLVDETSQVQTGAFADPLETLPLELWIQIISHLITKFDVFDSESYWIHQLLDLATVSRAWSNAIVSVPSFWTRVILDATDEDYLAKAVTCLQLSGLRELDVMIRVSLRIWEDVAPRIVSHGKRFRSLTLLPLEYKWPLVQQDPQELIDILSSFDELPILHELHVVTSRMDRASFNRRSPNGTLESLILKCMPSLQTVADLPLTWETVGNLRPSEIKRFAITELGDSMIQALVRFPDLQHLDLLLRLDSPPPARLSGLRIPVSSVHIQIPETYPLHLLCGCLSLGLRSITITQIDVARFFDTLSYLQQFQDLDHISLYLTQTLRLYDVPPNISQPYRFLSGTSLELGFGVREEHGADMWLVRWSNAIFDALINAMPNVEVLKLVGDIPSNAFLHYIKTLDRLRQLHVHCNLKAFPAFPHPRAGHRLEHLSWSGNLPTQFFDHFEFPLLHILSLSGKSGQNQCITRSECSSTNFYVPMLICSPPLIVTACVTSLCLTTEHPIYWDLASFPVVNQVHLKDSIWNSDFCEQLLLRPNECPRLEHLTISGRFCEWDVLLLMLERRNLAIRPSVSPIRTIKFDSELSVKLIYPISSLLRGKFLTDIRIAEFSLRYIAKGMFDPARTGCVNCCQRFRECDSPIVPLVTYDPSEYEGFGWHYDLPYKFLSPEPQLPSEIASWIAGKRARRVAYILKYENARFSRASDCSRGIQKCSRVVTAYSERFDWHDEGG